jgi:hypothetical protein
MGMKPDEIRSTTLYDFNLMAQAFAINVKHDFDVMRHNAYLISIFSGLDNKTRKKITPQKMFPLDSDEIKKDKLTKDQVLDILNQSKKRQARKKR